MKYVRRGVIYIVILLILFYIGNNFDFLKYTPPTDRYVKDNYSTVYESGVKADKEEKVYVNNELIEAELIYVVDGDTIKVKVNGEELKIRLIGINTPESVHEDSSKNNEYGLMASEFTKQLLNGYKIVYLQYDEEQKDQYGRELCYVWLEGDVDLDSYEDVSTYMLNGIILQEGYAFTMFYEPNIKYEEYFELLKNYAAENKMGLWIYEEFRQID